MSRRNPLKNIIIDAWIGAIDNDYMRQRINSERSLQASFWSQLNQRLPATRRIFIEPSMQIKTLDGIKKLIPDIVVCNTKQVISVVELKYLPRAQPNYTKDINSLALIAKQRQQVSVSNSRYRGAEADSRQYTLSENMLFVWAGIHATPKREITNLYSNENKSLENEFMQLHAETRHNASPKIYYYE